MTMLILQLANSALQIYLTRAANPTADVSADMLALVQKAVDAYQKETGKPLDVELIKPYIPIP